MKKDSSPNIMCVIPARGGSKGIPRKNLKPLLGKPLITYVIEAALKSKYLKKVIVSTEDEEIAGVARAHKAEVPFIRPKELALDHIPLIYVYKHALRAMDEMGYRADIYVAVQPTVPLISSGDIDSAIEKMLKTDCDSVLTMRKIEEEHPFRMYTMQDDEVLPFNEYTTDDNRQRQDRPPAYKFNGACVVRKRYLLDEWSGKDLAWGKDRRGIIMPPERSVDIDAPLDFTLCETILSKKSKDNSRKQSHARTVCKH